MYLLGNPERTFPRQQMFAKGSSCHKWKTLLDGGCGEKPGVCKRATLGGWVGGVQFSWPRGGGGWFCCVGFLWVVVCCSYFCGGLGGVVVWLVCHYLVFFLVGLLLLLRGRVRRTARFPEEKDGACRGWVGGKKLDPGFWVKKNRNCAQGRRDSCLVARRREYCQARPPTT